MFFLSRDFLENAGLDKHKSSLEQLMVVCGYAISGTAAGELDDQRVIYIKYSDLSWCGPGVLFTSRKQHIAMSIYVVSRYKNVDPDLDERLDLQAAGARRFTPCAVQDVAVRVQH